MGERMNTLECINCGAPIQRHTTCCAYCGTNFENRERLFPNRYRIKIFDALFNQSVGVKEFGVSNSIFPVAGLCSVFILYVLGWFFEDTQYWLNKTALTIWVGIIPVILFVVSLFWSTERKVIYIGFGLTSAIFIVHILVIWMIRGDLWDDHVGIAAVVAGAMLISWTFGRALHAIFRLRNL